MSIQRYRQIEPVELSTIDRYIPTGMTVALVGQDPVLFVDLNLSDDAGKDDLDQYMVTLGWVFVETDPTSPRPVLPSQTQSPVIQIDLTTPPVSPIAGDRYIVATGGTGAWATHDDEIAEWDGVQWQFTPPLDGMTTWNQADRELLVYTGEWEVTAPRELGSFSPADAVLTDAQAPTLMVRNDREMLAYGATGAPKVSYFAGDVQRSYVPTANLRVKIFWVAATATTGDVRWAAAFERLQPDGPDVDVDNFAANVAENSPTNAVNGLINSTIIPFTNAEAGGIRPGNPFRLRINRLSNAGGDTMAGDAQVMRVVVVQ